MWEQPIPAFEPHPLLRGGHRQTIAGAYLWRRLPYQATCHQVSLEDGDQLVLHDDCPPKWRHGDRVVLLLHGLAGCHGSGYMSRVATKLVQRGFRAFRLDQRGCGLGIELARQTFHAGRTEDVLRTIDVIEQECGTSPITLVGFSLGGGIALKLLGQRGSEVTSAVDSAIAVAPPIDLKACSQNIGRGMNRVYDRSFVRTLMDYVGHRSLSIPELAAISSQPRPQSLFEFDARYTAPLGGFTDVDDYYTRCSSHGDLNRVRVRTHILTAADDPLVPVQMFSEVQVSSTTRLFVSDHGGHLGFVGRAQRGCRPDADWHWMDWRIVQWTEEFDRG